MPGCEYKHLLFHGANRKASFMITVHIAIFSLTAAHADVHDSAVFCSIEPFLFSKQVTWA